MVEPHCFFCGLAGYWTCEMCGRLVMDDLRDDLDGFELCQECLELLPDAG
jgi:formylmethanofuran dehydrogenase subunit E